MPYPSIYDKAIQFLARREYSEQELNRKLKPYYPEASTEISEVLARLKSQNYLNDQRFMSGRIHHRLQQGYGPHKIVEELTRLHGLNKEDILKQLKSAKEDNEVNPVLKHLLQKRMSRMDLADPQAQAKLIQYCLRRGFELKEIKAELAALNANFSKNSEM